MNFFLCSRRQVTIKILQKKFKILCSPSGVNSDHSLNFQNLVLQNVDLSPCNGCTWDGNKQATSSAPQLLVILNTMTRLNKGGVGLLLSEN